MASRRVMLEVNIVTELVDVEELVAGQENAAQCQVLGKDSGGTDRS